MSERDTSTPSPGLLPSWWTLTRDVLTFLGGWAVIFWEIRRPEIRDSVLLLGGGAVGIPGLVLGATSVLDAFRNRGGTGGPPGSPPADPSPSSPPSSSPAA